MGYTNLHPGEQANIARDSNIYYARVRGGRIERVGGQQVGSLDDPIAPNEGDLVWDGTAPAWIHDVATDASGNPVLVFASFPTATDHRYHYARWTGSVWQVTEIVAAGGSFAEEAERSPRYSGGHHTRPRGPVACLPLAAGGRGRLAGGDAERPPTTA